MGVLVIMDLSSSQSEKVHIKPTAIKDRRASWNMLKH